MNQQLDKPVGASTPTPRQNAAPTAERIRCRDVVKTGIYLSIGLTIFWLEQALNLIFSIALIALAIGLVWLSIFTAVSTSFLWLPACLICLPLLTTVGLLLRYTRLRGFLSACLGRLQQEPLKSKIWSKGVLALAQNASSIYFRLFPDRQVVGNCGYALLTLDGIIKTEGIFSQLGQHADIFQLQLYYYAALQATRLDSLEGLRVLDVSHGQADHLKFLTKNFQPHSVIGYDSVRRQFTTGMSSYAAMAATMNLSQLLRKERRFDLILCIETWNKLNDHEGFLHQLRELLSQSNEQDQAPYIEDDQLLGRQRLVIADVFRKDEEEAVTKLLGKYFEIEDTIDISINVQKSIIKQGERRQKFLAGTAHVAIAFEAARQFHSLVSSSYCPLSYLTPKRNSSQSDTPLFLNNQGKYEMLQGRAHGAGHSYLIYVLKHRELLQDSRCETLHN